MKKGLLLFLLMVSVALSKAAPVVLIEQGGWLESSYVTWQKTSGLTYHVYISPASTESWTKLDDELVREYADYGRADALGLQAGSYQLKVVPVSNGTEVVSDATISPIIDVKAHNREGFVHKQAVQWALEPIITMVR